MVLRRPYAFLIKHFKLIHLIITALLALVAVVSRRVYQYLNVVIGETVNRYDAANYINYRIYIYLLLALTLCFAVYWLLKYKNKPRKMYIAVIAGYLVIGIFMGILFIYMQNFLNAVPDTKTIRLYRDILSIILVFQYFFILVTLIRGLGFDIKRYIADTSLGICSMSFLFCKKMSCKII